MTADDPMKPSASAMYLLHHTSEIILWTGSLWAFWSSLRCSWSMPLSTFRRRSKTWKKNSVIELPTGRYWTEPEVRPDWGGWKPLKTSPKSVTTSTSDSSNWSHTRSD